MPTNCSMRQGVFCKAVPNVDLRYMMKMDMPKWIFALMVGVGIIQFIIYGVFAVRIEQVAGYYECGKCGHKYVPSYGSASKAMHIGRTRYMKCPNCGKSSWQKKVMSKE